MKVTAKIELRKDYQTKDGKQMVCLRYTAYRRSSLISLNISVLPKNWNSKSYTIRSCVPFFRHIKKKLYPILIIR